MATEYPLIEAAGDPWTLGVQHGEQAARFIRGYLDSLAESWARGITELHQARWIERDAQTWGKLHQNGDVLGA